MTLNSFVSTVALLAGFSIFHAEGYACPSSDEDTTTKTPLQSSEPISSKKSLKADSLTLAKGQDEEESEEPEESEEENEEEPED